MGEAKSRPGPECGWMRGPEGYLVGERLGKGGFGEVRLAKRIEDGKQYACKIATEATGRRLLRQEAAIQRNIADPKRNGGMLFPTFHEVLETEDKTFLFMEYVMGISLKERIRRGELSAAEVFTIGIALAEGLQILHERLDPILYRDLKPEHVMLCGGAFASCVEEPQRVCGAWDHVRLLDLGCACRQSLAWKSRAGSKGYAAPEQLREGTERQGTYSDIYSLGKLLQTMSGGKIPVLDSLALQCTAEVPGERICEMRFVLSELRRMRAGRERAGRKRGKAGSPDAWRNFTVETCVCDCLVETV